MKKKTLLLLTALFALPSLISCGGNDIQAFDLTYKSAVNYIHSLKYEGLKQKIEDDVLNESFVLFTYSSDSPSCSCWLNIKQYCEYQYIPATNTLFYCIADGELKNVENSFGIKIPSSEPSICFFKNRKLVKQYDYGSHKSLFTPIQGEYKEFDNLMNRFTKNTSKLYKFDTYGRAIEALSSQEDNSIFYIYKTSCPDCKKSSSEVLLPYIKNNTFTTKIYILDIDQYVGTTAYQNVKDQLKLSESGNETFGYKNGYVPTFQYYEGNQLKDMTVYLNDEVDKNIENNTYYISDSYYSEERKNNLQYTSVVLKGQEISENEVNEVVYGEKTYYYWKTEFALAEHNPILTSFLDKYLK